MSYTAFLFRIPFGMNLAMATLTGNAIGAGNTPLAWRMVKLNGLCAVGISLLILVTCICLKAQLVELMTNDEEVAAMTSGVLIVYFAYMLPYHL